MTQYALRRLLAAIPVIVGVLIVTFVLARAIPGEPCTAMFGEKATPEICEIFNREKGLDKPLSTQFMIFARDMVTGDFGESIRFKRPVSDILIERLPLTIELGIAALTIAVLVGIPLGIISSTRRNSIVDVTTMIGANIGVSMPVFWLGLMLAYVFALLLKDTIFQLPPSGRLSAGVTPIPFYEVFGWQAEAGTLKGNTFEFFSNLYIFNSIITADWKVLGDAIEHLILPAVALATIPLAIIARMTRSSMLEVLGQADGRTAKAKGLPPTRIFLQHEMRNAILPVVTVLGPSIAGITTGSFVVELVFAIPGLGRYFVQAVQQLDYTVIMGTTVFFGAFLVLMVIMVDLLYGLLDPPVRVS